MTDEVNQNDEGTPEASNEAPKTRGYMTYEEWQNAGRDPEEYKGRKAFEKDGELYSYIQHQNKTVDRLQKSIEILNQNFEADKQKIREQTIAELQGKISAAASVADVENVQRFTKQLTEATASQPINQQVSQKSQEQIDAELAAEFKASNRELLDTADKFNDAVKLESFYRNIHGLSGPELFSRVKSDMSSKYGSNVRQPINPNIPNGSEGRPPVNLNKGGYEALSPFYKKEYDRQVKAYGDKFDKKTFIEHSLMVQDMEGKHR